MSISQKFFDSCANSISKYNKFNLWNKSEKWKHNGNKKKWRKKRRFSDRKFDMWHTPKCIFFVLSTKTEICNLAIISETRISCHPIMHHTLCDDLFVHISVLLLKQNICWHHKTNYSDIIMARYTVPISYFGHGFKTRHKNMQIGLLSEI